MACHFMENQGLKQQILSLCEKCKFLILWDKNNFQAGQILAISFGMDAKTLEGGKNMKTTKRFQCSHCDYLSSAGFRVTEMNCPYCKVPMLLGIYKQFKNSCKLINLIKV